MFFLELKYKINIIQSVGHIFHTDKSSPIASSPKSSTKKYQKWLRTLDYLEESQNSIFIQWKSFTKCKNKHVKSMKKKDAIHLNHMYLYVFVIFRQGGPVQLKAGVNEGLYKQ